MVSGRCGASRDSRTDNSSPSRWITWSEPAGSSSSGRSPAHCGNCVSTRRLTSVASIAGRVSAVLAVAKRSSCVGPIRAAGSRGRHSASRARLPAGFLSRAPPGATGCHAHPRSRPSRAPAPATVEVPRLRVAGTGRGGTARGDAGRRDRGRRESGSGPPCPPLPEVCHALYGEAPVPGHARSVTAAVLRAIEAVRKAPSRGRPTAEHDLTRRSEPA